MDSMTAAEAKQKFGKLMEKAQRGPVEITKHGHAISVLVSKEDYERDQFFRTRWLKEKLKRSDEDIRAGRIYDADDVYAEMRELINTLYADKD